MAQAMTACQRTKLQSLLVFCSNLLCFDKRWCCLTMQFIRLCPVIPNKYQHIVFAFFMALLMSCLMSLVISVFNVGLVPDILSIWLHAWLFAFVVAFPAVMLVAPIVRKLVAKVVKPL
jgi:hypothetical protein